MESAKDHHTSLVIRIYAGNGDGLRHQHVAMQCCGPQGSLEQFLQNRKVPKSKLF